MRAVLADYGVGNLHSLAKSLVAAGADVVIEADPANALSGDLLVLPGVGAFAPAALWIGSKRHSICDALQSGHPCLAICLGMQLLFETSEEAPGDGLGVISGHVRRLTTRRIPHMGWNALEDVRDPLIQTAALSMAYYAHSFTCVPATQEVVYAWSAHEHERLPAVVRVARTLGVQFHPEKSGSHGQALVAAFVQEIE
ncbi:MAG: imidazole glycerol phosphate synthase subunit HisH [Gemmatimonadaceae bacterium]